MSFYFFYCLTCVLLALTPGPDNLAAITIAATSGRKAGIRFVSGLCSGLFGHTLLVVTGLAVIVQTHAGVLLALKIAGASYLLYLAWQSLRASRQMQALPQAIKAEAKVYRKGMLMSLGNPKLLLFFMAFLPQFLRPDQGSQTLQLLILALLFIVVSFVVFSALVFLVEKLKASLLQPARQQQALARLHQIAAVVFVLLALKLLM